MRKNFIYSLLFFVLFNQTAYAGKCLLKITRTPCANKEDIAFKPYNGKNPTEESKTLASESECVKHAQKSVKIVRKGVLKEKSIEASFDNIVIKENFNAKSECD